MLDRKVVKEFLEDRLEGIRIPEDIPIEALSVDMLKMIIMNGLRTILYHFSSI